MRFQKLHKLSKGFTLAELLVVVAITIILAGFGFVAVINYRWSLKVTEMDDTARSIFVAAQNHLTAAKADGTWDQIYDAKNGTVTGATKCDKTYLTYLSDYSESDGGVKTDHDFYYVIYKPGAATTGVLDTILPFGSIDDTVRSNNNYVIEFDAKTASIYGVFYTDSGKEITIADDISNLSAGGVTDGRHSRDTRKAHVHDSQRDVIGYYGGAAAKVFTTTEPMEVSVDITNADTLTAVIHDKKHTDTNKSILTITFTGQQSKTEESFAVTIAGSSGAYSVTGVTGRKLSDGSAVDAANLKSAISVKSGTSGIDYTVVLDDITKANNHFAEILKDYIPGEDITVTATVVAGTAKPATASKATNSLFDSIKLDGSSYIAYIGNGRQLQNLEPKVSNLSQELAASNGCLITEAEVLNSIKWDQFTADNGNVIEIGSGTEIPEGGFLSIANSKLNQFDGKRYVISSLKYKGNQVKDYYFAKGLIGVTSDILSGEANSNGLNIHDVFIRNASVIQDTEDEKKQGYVVYAGGLIGWSGPKSSIVGCGVLNDSDKYDQYSIEAENGTAGGLIGIVASLSSGDYGFLVSKSFASVPVRAKNYAGGLIGIISYGSSGTSSINIESSYVGGENKDSLYDNPSAANVITTGGDAIAAAGGLIGNIYILNINTITLGINDCYSTASVYSEKISGGLVGGNSASSTVAYNNCYATGTVLGGSTASKGTIIGYVSGSIPKGSKTYALLGSNLLWDRSSDDSQRTLANLLIKDSSLLLFGGSTDNTAANAAGFNNISRQDLIASANGTSATPYTATLKNAYPFKGVNSTRPEISASATYHYGDWPTNEAQAIKFTKTIDLTTSQAVLSSIINGTSGTSGMSLTVSKDGKTISVPINKIAPTEISTTKYSYSFEMTLPFGQFQISEENRSYTGMTQTVSTYFETSDGNKTLSNSDTDISFTFTVGTDKISTLNITNTYDDPAPTTGYGTVYYEIVDGKMYYHGYINGKVIKTKGVGSDGLLHVAGKTVSEAGYLVVIPNKGNGADKIKIGNNSEIQIKKEDALVSVADSYLSNMGLSTQGKAYKISQDTIEYNDYYYYSEYGFDAQYSSLPITIKNNKGIIQNTVYINPYFADEIYLQKNTSEPFKVRTADQVRWLANYYRSGTTALSTQSNRMIQQTFDIDFGYDSPTIDVLNTVYSGSLDDSGKSYQLKKLNKPLFNRVNGKVLNISVNNIRSAITYDMPGQFINYVNKGAVINNVYINGISTPNSERVYARDKFAGVIADNNGIISNLTVNSTTISQLNGYSDTYYGVVGNNSGSISDLQVTSFSVNINNQNDMKSSFGLIGYNSGDIKRITGQDVTISGTSGYDSGIIAYNKGSIDTINIKTYKLTNYNGDYHCGLLAHNDAGQISNVTADNVEISDSNGEAVGLIAYNDDGGIISKFGASNVNVSGITGTYSGFVAYNNATINGVTAANVTFSNLETDRSGLIADNTEKGIVTGITASGITVNDSIGTVPAVIGINSGTISSSTFSQVNITGSEGKYAGFIGYNEGTIKGLSADGLTMSAINKDLQKTWGAVNYNAYSGVIGATGSENAISFKNVTLKKNDNGQTNFAFVGTDYGTLTNVKVNNLVSDGSGFVYELFENGKIEDCHIGTVDNGTTAISGAGFVETASDDASISGCTVENAVILGNGFAGSISTGNSIDASSVIGGTIAKNGFIETNNGKIQNCAVKDVASVGQNGFADVNNGPGSISNSTVENVSTIGTVTDTDNDGTDEITYAGNGFIRLNQSGNFATGDATLANDKVITTGVIYGNGFAKENQPGKYSSWWTETTVPASILKCSVSASSVTDSSGNIIMNPLEIKQNGFIDINASVIEGGQVIDAYMIGSSLDTTSDPDNPLIYNGFAGSNSGTIASYEDNSTNPVTVTNSSVIVRGNIYGNGFVGNNSGQINNAEVNLSEDAISYIDDYGDQESVARSLAIGFNGFADSNTVIKDETSSGQITNSIVKISGTIGKNGFVGTNGTAGDTTMALIKQCKVEPTVNPDGSGTLDNLLILENGFVGENHGTIIDSSATATTITGNGFAEYNTSSQSIENSSVTATTINGNGFIGNNTGKIANSKVIADTVLKFAFVDTNGDNGSISGSSTAVQNDLAAGYEYFGGTNSGENSNNTIAVSGAAPSSATFKVNLLGLTAPLSLQSVPAASEAASASPSASASASAEATATPSASASASAGATATPASTPTPTATATPEATPTPTPTATPTPEATPTPTPTATPE